jgi:hypothetical protein
VIQEARVRLTQQYGGDQKRQQMIEAAYDAILMDRLRLRQEGKIKVPDGIRFAEKAVNTTPNVNSIQTPKGPGWLQRLIDTPSRADILWPTGMYLGLAVMAIISTVSNWPLSVILALGMGFSFYFVNRKENKLGRAFLLTLAALVLGTILGQLIGVGINPVAINLSGETITTLITLALLWLVSCFLR